MGQERKMECIHYMFPVETVRVPPEEGGEGGGARDQRSLLGPLRNLLGPLQEHNDSLEDRYPRVLVGDKELYYY